MKKIPFDPEEQVPFRYRPSIYRYELIARLATEARCSMQKVINDQFSPRKSRSEMERLRATQRKQGIPDEKFYPPILLRRFGIKIPPGRMSGRMRTSHKKK